MDSAIASSTDQTRTALDLGSACFISHKPLEMLRPWNGSDFGTYEACEGETGKPTNVVVSGLLESPWTDKAGTAIEKCRPSSSKRPG